MEVEQSLDGSTGWLVIALIMIGPVISGIAVVRSNLTFLATIVCTLMIPVIILTLFVLHWWAGSVFLGRPGLPID